MYLSKLYRKLFYSGGYGVHSPFVFRLITYVIGQKKCAYYAYDAMDRLRLKLKHDSETQAVEKQTISKKKGELLFRLANEFQPRLMLQVGASQGMAALYMTAYSKSASCQLWEADEEQADLAEKVLKKANAAQVELCRGGYETLVKRASSEAKQFDCFFFHLSDNVETLRKLLPLYLSSARADAVFIVDDIRACKAMKELWRELIQREDVTVSIDLYDMGLLFVNKKYNKKNYTVYY